MDILGKIQKMAEETGFDLVGVAEIASPLAMTNENGKLDEWVKNGYHAEMKWFADTVEKRNDILKVMPDAKSVICVAMNYYCDTESKKELTGLEAVGKIARYARGRDYHKIFDNKLKLFVKRLENIFCETEQRLPRDSVEAESIAMTNVKFKYYSDTGPVLERVWAARSGLGFIGKNTNLITKYGSWVLLGEIIMNVELKKTAEEISQQNKGGCGDCKRCLDACPTGALVALPAMPTGQAGGRHGPYTVDARKCISYLTIEHKGEIPMELREKMGNRIFGCDACQEVCPFNIGRQTEGINFKTAQSNIANYHFNRYSVKSDNNEIDLKEILSIKTDEEFLNKFAGSPLMRAKRRGLARNVCIAAGNLGDKSLLSYLKECLNDKEPIIASHAKWAIEEIEKMVK